MCFSETQNEARRHCDQGERRAHFEHGAQRCFAVSRKTKPTKLTSLSHLNRFPRIVYRPNFLSQVEADSFFARLVAELPWEQQTDDFGPHNRLTVWCGEHPYAYAGLEHPASKQVTIFQSIKYVRCVSVWVLLVEYGNRFSIWTYFDIIDNLGVHSWFQKWC